MKKIMLLFVCITILMWLTGCQSAKENELNKEIKIKTARDLITSNISSLSNAEIEGLYRFQGKDYNSIVGKQDTNDITYYWGTTNYICFGIDSTEDCLENTNKYMYRIIGVATSGGLKLIKDSPLEKKEWSLEKNDTVLWPDSIIYNSLNNEGYLNNKEYFSDDLWKSMIKSSNWKYGILDLDKFHEIDKVNDHKTLYKELEDYLTQSIDAKIGLLSATDYYHSYLLQSNNDSDEGEESTWLDLDDWELTMYNYDRKSTQIFAKTCDGKYDDNPNSICHKDGCTVYGRKNNLYGETIACDKKAIYRPTFYTIDNIEFLQGNGTPDNPFIIKK